ncbi:helix-turn-helix transcriptional regulator [Ornithinimicrobium pratense]|uniref:WYL domain-containing protein n=1 Tax=Ornithinimicrobium pratense TaxID=2593973 RepID=A0A5J6V6A3_9MICO|nr:WYL domain-containing protein [Ornithinimicrobium pratense]QFG68656.1 WYL domain-containing protein [Ornithinimicrobium pratense]
MVTFESATSRVSRLLTMVPWLLNRQGIDLASAAAQLGVSEDQVVEDLELLFVCGLPGHYPDDLIEASWEDGRVFVGNADTIARPLRLGRDEALALIVALRALAATPGLTEHEAIDRALAKLEAAAGDAAASADQVRVDLDAPVDPALAARIRTGLTEQRRLHLRYTSASRDETTERDVDPLRVLSVDGYWYLEAWCHRARGVRTFRLDRVEAVEVLDEPAAPPQDLAPRDVVPGVFKGDPQDLLVTLELQPAAAWVAESIPSEQVERRDDGSTVMVLRVADPAWLHRLVWREGGAVRVVHPPAAVAAVRDGAAAALAGHAQHTDR